jgi:Helix-turn-helix domain
MSEEILTRLERLEAMLVVLVEGAQVREWYSVEEFARSVGRAEFTVREWCRLGRITAQKRLSGRGGYSAWVISHEELLRYQRRGLLPIQSKVKNVVNRESCC